MICRILEPIEEDIFIIRVKIGDKLCYFPF